MLSVLLCCLAHQALKEVPWVGSYSVVHFLRCLMHQPLYFSAADADLWRERGYDDGYLCMTQHYGLASVAPWLSSTGISHHDLLPHIPLIHVSAVNSSPHTGIAPQSLNSSSKLSFQETLVSAQRVYGCGKDCLILIPFKLPQISCFTLSLKLFSSDSDNCPTVGIGFLLQFPHQPRVGPVLLILLFSP